MIELAVVLRRTWVFSCVLMEQGLPIRGWRVGIGLLGLRCKHLRHDSFPGCLVKSLGRVWSFCSSCSLRLRVCKFTKWNIGDVAKLFGSHWLD